MATKVLSNEFMQNIATEEAWKELSSNFSWTEAMLEKYQDKVNWDEISENRNIRWTLPMIQKFQKKINWDRFSEYADEHVLTDPIWEVIIDSYRHSIYEKYAIEFYEKFKDYIPVSKLQNTNLWSSIVQQRSKQLAADICM